MNEDTATVTTEAAPEAPVAVKPTKAKKKKAKPVTPAVTGSALFGVRAGSVRDIYHRALVRASKSGPKSAKELSDIADEINGSAIPGGAGRLGAYLGGLLPGVKGFINQKDWKLQVDRKGKPITYHLKRSTKVTEPAGDESAPPAREESPATETAPEAPVS